MSGAPHPRDRWGRRTRWTVIRAATTEKDREVSGKAWEELIERYREPVHAAVRRIVGQRPDADEIAEDFFSYLYSQKVLEKAEPSMGRFRCFMQGVIRRYVLHRLRPRPDRSGPIDVGDADLPAPELPPEVEEREEAEWALTVLKHATTALVQRHPRDGKLLLRAFGIPPYPLTSRSELCKETGLTSNALNVALHRARRHLRDLIVAEIRDLVGDDRELEVESEVLGQRLMNARPELFGDDDSFYEWTESAH